VVGSVRIHSSSKWTATPERSRSPNLNLIERLWKFVKLKVLCGLVSSGKQCLYAKYYADFVTFKAAMVTCLGETHTQHQSALDLLITLRFQTFEKAQFMTV
jgi:hypothetical protein